MRLFQEQGYAETTVDQIAEAAEVSPSTFFRYFPNKEDVVLSDDSDALLIAAFNAQPPDIGPIAAVRAAMREVFAHMSEEAKAREQQRHDLMRLVPELRSVVLDEYRRSLQVAAELVADRVGLAADEFAIQMLAGAMIGVALAVVDHSARLPQADFTALLDEGFALLEAGLPLPCAQRSRPAAP